MLGNIVLLQSDYKCHNHSPLALYTLGSSDINQKHEDILPDDGMLQAQNSLVTPVKEVNHVEYKVECVICHKVSKLNSDGSQSKEPMNDNMEQYTTLCKTDCCAGRLVMETGPADSVATDCSEVELAHNTDENCTKVTLCCIKWTLSSQNKINSEKETGVNTSKSFIHTLQKQVVTQQRNNAAINEEPMFRDVRAVDNYDGTSSNESTFGSDQKRFTYSDSSFIPKMIRNSQLAGSEDDIANLYLACRNAPVHKNETRSQKTTGYANSIYPILVKNSVKVYPANLFASLPQHDKFLVKQKLLNSTARFTTVKLVLKSCSTEAEQDTNTSYATVNHQLPLPYDDNDDDDNDDDDDDDADDDITSAYYRQNCNNPGCILDTSDRMKYPLPNRMTVITKIGKGGNGFFFTLRHHRKHFAIKKTVYQSNEINVHSVLKHSPLMAVLMEGNHECHHGKFYCFHFMPQMDYDLRQILSAKDISCMKYFYRSCSREPMRWEKGFDNIKFVLSEILETLAYLCNNGYVHRGVKASNIMIKMRCHCRLIECTCSTKFHVKLGDFDSAGIVPGLGITEPLNQVIKFASTLPLGTGHRAPEVSITLSGPYETLYTTAVDMWSFECLCLNICIGKTGALSQQEEASLLLSRTNTCSIEIIMQLR